MIHNKSERPVDELAVKNVNDSLTAWNQEMLAHLKSKDNFEHKEQVLCKYVWITCLSYCATEVLILDKNCGAKCLRGWNFIQATAEDPGRQDEDDADHLEKMTDYKSYCKVCVHPYI